MKKILLSALVAGLLIAGVSTEAVVSNNDERGYVSVSASANKEIASDVAEISIEVQTFDSKSMQNATVQNKQISDKVYSAMKEMVNPANGDFVKTANYNAAPIYNYSSGKRSFDKYQVSNSIIVRTKNLKAVGPMIDKALSLGATNINNLSFTVSNYDSQCDELLSKAAQKARNQADILTRSVSSVVTGVKSIDGSCSNTNSHARIHYNLMDLAKASGAVMETATPIESGTVKIYANVSASFYVK